jgi:hypothetical protein
MDIEELDRIKLNPQKVYANPQDVAGDMRLSKEERLEILAAWEQDARRLAESTSEGMGGGEDSRLREVAKARASLE